MNELQKKYQDGAVVIGTWMQTPNTEFAELAAAFGFDFCTVDMEHTGMGVEVLSDIYRGLRGSTCCPCARIASNELMNIRRPLDLGASAIFVPLIGTAAQAREAVAAAKYPPEGVRGYAFCRANNWGMNFDHYIRSSNDDILLLMMIETREGVENIDEILAVPGVNGVLIGPYDLSGSYGISGRLDSPEVKAAIAHVADACRLHGKIAGQHIVRPTRDNVRQAIDIGYRFLALGMDVIYLQEGLARCKQTAYTAVAHTEV